MHQSPYLHMEKLEAVWQTLNRGWFGLEQEVIDRANPETPTTTVEHFVFASLVLLSCRAETPPSTAETEVVIFKPQLLSSNSKLDKISTLFFDKENQQLLYTCKNKSIAIGIREINQKNPSIHPKTKNHSVLNSLFLLTTNNSNLSIFLHSNLISSASLIKNHNSFFKKPLKSSNNGENSWSITYICSY